MGVIKYLWADDSPDNPYAYLNTDIQLLYRVNQVSRDLNAANYAKNTGYLVFWESPFYFVVLGHSCSIADDVWAKRCHSDAIPIVRRVSGGGTVLQGPGCLNYAIILPIAWHEKLGTISDTNRYIMTELATAFQKYIPSITVQGYTDLAINAVKFSGNAQRRLANSLVFHGTLLYQFDCEKISYYLKQPLRQPAYRKNRSHATFVDNCGLSRDTLVQCLVSQWGAQD